MSRQRRQVLVLDDDAGCRDVLSLVFESVGYEVKALANAAIGLALLRSWRADLIVLDWVMPDLDGAAFLAEQQRDGIAAIPVLVLTASRLDGAAKALGASAIVFKPFNLDELLATSARLLGPDPGQADAEC